MKQTLIIKNMVCPRCTEAVKQIFETLDFTVIDVKLGCVVIEGEMLTKQKQRLEKSLMDRGFELLDDKQAQIINQIKSFIIKEIHHKNEASSVNFSNQLAKELHYDYAHLSRLFSSVEGQTIEKFVMNQKIEKVKELLSYNELNLSEIAFRLNYSSSAHLSAQFKKITGMTPSAFKKLHRHNRQSLDRL